MSTIINNLVFLICDSDADGNVAANHIQVQNNDRVGMPVKLK